MKKTYIIPLLTLFVGIGLGYSISGATKKSVVEPLPDKTQDVEADSFRERFEALRKENSRLKNRISDLQAATTSNAEPVPKDLPAEIETVPVETASDTQEHTHQPRSSADFRERFERLKTENPERYAAIQKHQEEIHNRISAEVDEKTGFLASIDTSSMTDDQYETHVQLLETIAKCDAFRERMRIDTDNPLTPDEMPEMWEAVRSLGPLMEQERRYLLEEVGKAYGDNNGTEFADYLEKIIDITSVMPRGGFGPGGGFGPSGRGPGGGRGGRRGGN